MCKFLLWCQKKPFSQSLRQQQRLTDASLRAAGDGRHVAEVRSQRGEAVGKLADHAQPDGLGGGLLSPRSGRRDCATASPSLDSAGRCGLASNVTPQGEDVTNTPHSFLHDSRATSARQSMSSEPDQMAAFLSRCLRSRCSPPTAPIAPPLQHTCPAQPITIQQHPRTRRARHIAHDGPRPTHHLPRTLTTLGMLFSGLTGRYVLRAGPSSRRLWIPPLRAARAGAGFAGVRIAFGVRIRVGARLGPS